MNIEEDDVCKNYIPPSRIQDPAALKSLYRLLLDLSSRDVLCDPYLNGASEIFNAKLNSIIEFKEIRFLSDVLFKVLLARFEELLSVVNNASATTGLNSKLLETPEELILVLRCCMVILNLLVSDQNLITEKCEVLFSILGRLCYLNLSAEMEQNSWSFKKTVSSDCTYANNHRTTSVEENIFASLCFTSSEDLLPSLVSTIFEVYADELLTHSTLWKYSFLINSSSATSRDKLFLCHTSHSVIEVIAASFHTSFFHDQSFEDIFNRSFWTPEKHFKTPELSLCAGLSLILNPIMFSAPKLLQAHVISLVAETIGTNVISESGMLDQGIIDRYVSAFESSVILYARNLSSIQVKGHPRCTLSYATKSSLHVNSFHQSFESYIQPLTRDKIDGIITKFECAWDASLSELYFRRSADLAAASIAYIKEDHSVVDDLGKDEMLTMLQIITLIASEDVSNTASLQTQTIEISAQDLCLITTILKLMSCSLLQVLRYVKHRKSTQTVNTSRDASPCTDYVRVLKIVSGYFQQSSTHLPVQSMLCDVMARYPTKYKESKLMLLHFSGILSLCYTIGHEFLLKGCIYTMMVSLNLIVSEEGDVEALRSVLDSPELKVYSSQIVPENAQQVLVKRTPSLVVASKFQKVQTVYLSSYTRKKTLTVERTEINLQKGVTETLETSSAKIFLKCILQGGPDEAPSDIDDLAGFIECKEGKDYAHWLKDREKYRKFRHEKKFALSKGKKRKSTCRKV